MEMYRKRRWMKCLYVLQEQRMKKEGGREGGKTLNYGYLETTMRAMAMRDDRAPTPHDDRRVTFSTRRRAPVRLYLNR